MDPKMGHQFNDEQRALAQSVDAFCTRESWLEDLSDFPGEGTSAHDQKLYERMAAAGWAGLTIPEKYGGSGGTLTDVAILTERLAYHRVPVGGYLTSVITVQLIVRFGTEEQKRELLPLVAQGTVLAIAITEPDTGSDAASITTRATRDEDCWRIDGEKVYTSNANHAGFVVVVTRTDRSVPKHNGITLFLLPMDREGVSYSRLKTLGHIDTNITYYEDVRATEADVIGEVDKGWQALVRGLNSERLIIAAEGLGLAQRAFDDAVAYSKQRHQFGQPISRFQALQHGFAETATRLLSTRLLTYHTAALLDAGDPAPMQASMAKLAATELARDAALQGMQFMGGAGYTMEYDMQGYLRDSVVMTIFGGTSQIQKNIIAGQLGLNA
jgi:alkylation response protein AidB-like acyl-CoA dehydrogenase